MEQEFNEKEAKLGLLFLFEGKRDQFDKDYHFNFNLQFVLVNDFTSKTRIRNCTKYSHDSKYKVLHGINFQVVHYVSRSYATKERPFQYYTNIYFDGYHPDLPVLETAVKSLNKIKKAMDKMESHSEYSSDWKIILDRFARAAKISCFVEITSSGQNYDCCTFKLHTIPEGIEAMRNILERDETFQKEIQIVLNRPN